MSHGLIMPFNKTAHTRIIATIAQGMSLAKSLENYLELGISRGSCFNEVAPFAKNAWAVEMNQTSYDHIKHNKNLKWYQGSTDNFFSDKNLKLPKFDLIFIDAEHSHEASKKDFINSFKILRSNGIICLHDTYPPKEWLFEHCKDSYKTAEYIRGRSKVKNSVMESVTLPFYYGVTIVRKANRQLMWRKNETAPTKNKEKNIEKNIKENK